MRTHDHDHERLDGESLRPQPGRVDQRLDAVLWRAAAVGRTDVLGAPGLLGLQRVLGNTGVQRLAEDERSPVLDVVSSGSGRPLEEPVRADMEGRLGADFGDVRVHTGEAAAASASAVNAHAYTVGSNVVFQRDRYDPSSTAGRTMLAHELTHVVQQRSGPVEGTAAPGGVRVSDPSDRFEREAAANAERVMSDPAPVAAVSTPAAVGSAGAVQRAEEETAQGSFVQREEAGQAVEAEEDPKTAQGAFVQRQDEEEEGS